MTKVTNRLERLLVKKRLQYPDIELCENCVDVWEIPNKYDHCPVCKKQCFVHMTRTNAVHHIYECLKTLGNDGK